MRTLRFLHAYARSAPVVAEEVMLRVGGEAREATLLRPARALRGPFPGWVVLHGLTVPGREHAALQRFTRALAASGAAVLVPDVPAWRALRIETTEAKRTIIAGAEFLATRPEVREGGAGVIGFSFGATQALVAAADPQVHPSVRAVAGFGGYCDLARIVRALLTGEHEWDGHAERIDPDPYGRWILAANYLTRAPDFEEMHAVAEGARALALESGRVGAWAWEPAYDARKAEIRAGLTAPEREVWDRIAPPAGVAPPRGALAEQLAQALTSAALAFDPALDPRPLLARVSAPAILVHGRDDRLVPYTESLRLAQHLPPERLRALLVTGLFAHSAHAAPPGPLAYAAEAWRFARVLGRVLRA